MSRITQGLLADEKELKMGKKSWEGSAADTAQDKKLAKKHGMSMTDWEKSSMDTKHDTQKSMKGLRGGGIAVKGKGIALKKGGSIKEAGGEMYASKAAMKKHEAKESPAMEKAEHKRGGGIAVKGKGIALKHGGKVGKYAMGGNVVTGGGMGSALPGFRPGMKIKDGPGGGGGVPLPPNLGGGGGGRGPSRPFKDGGEVRKRGGGIAQRGMGIAMKGGGRAKGCM